MSVHSVCACVCVCVCVERESELLLLLDLETSIFCLNNACGITFTVLVSLTYTIVHSYS